jgi:hypothetical protein
MHQGEGRDHRFGKAPSPIRCKLHPSRQGLLPTCRIRLPRLNDWTLAPGTHSTAAARTVAILRLSAEVGGNLPDGC